ncbi:MAG: hypothetical protein KC486_09730 [Myxococcales bacterium]|nr:hypothetical protein [Myxococcales bacterium]
MHISRVIFNSDYSFLPSSTDGGTNAEPPRSRWRWPVIGALILVGGYVLWMLVLNLALWTGFVPWVVSGQHRMSRIHLGYDSAWVLWPTEVHVKGLVLRIDAYRYQLELEVPEGEMDVALHELLSRRLHVHRVDADGARATFRFKAPEGQVSERRRALFGPIVGHGAPIRDAEPPELPKEGEAWELDLENINGGFSELWIDALRIVELDARLRGRLRTRAGSLFAVDGGHLDLAAGAILVGDERLAEALEGTLAVEIRDYDPFSIKGREVLKQVRADIDASARIVDLGPAQPLLPESARLHLGGGAGLLRLDVDVVDGVLQPGTSIDYGTEALMAAHTPVRGRAGVHVRAEVRREDDADEGRLAVELCDLKLWRNDEAGDDDEEEGGEKERKRAPIFAPAIEASVTTSVTDLASDAFALTGAEVRTAKAIQLRELRALAGLSDRIDPRAGSASLTLRSTLREGERLGHRAKLSVENAAVAVDRTTIRLSGDLELRGSSGLRFGAGELDTIDLDVRQLAIRSPKGHSTGAWLKVTRGDLEWGPATIKATLEGQLDDLRPILSHVDERNRLIERFTDHDVTKPLDFKVDLRRGEDGALDLRVHHLRRPALHIEAFRRSRGDRSRSAFRLTGVRIGVAVDEHGDRDADLGADAAWMERKIAWAKEL